MVLIVLKCVDKATIVDALEEIPNKFNDISSVSDANILLKSMDSEFLIAFQVVKVVENNYFVFKNLYDLKV